MNKLYRLEQYTEKRRQEVLLVTAEVDGELDQIMIFRGFSSSLVRPTAFDPDIPILPETAKILTLDRLLGPYNPSQPNYLQQGLTWETVQPLLSEVGV
ncbi:hypothetical protein K9N68_00780 [Kovacikia minuta CCNUW1]|uniref:DUF7734 family protein n=1 Tax=Kovacikia minuta TaxID=2931930 RepID=UPI001CCE98DB|nr:hypothetical protein [Kovacikia minuta]UBF26581.1 hypothetical protein K9N68_00780 [Kovacikia minuta CCNUW1]